MSKVVIELDETEEKTDLDIYIHRYEILGALREMDELRRSIYKGWHNFSKVLVRDKKSIVTDEELHSSEYNYNGVVEYIDSSEVMDRIDSILEDVYRYLN